MMGMAMALGAGGDFHGSNSHYTEPTEEEKKRAIERRNRQAKANVLAKGAKEWTIDGITVIARNEKNAIRKIENIKREQKTP